jgi:ribosome-associated translation inhibitor RaiA
MEYDLQAAIDKCMVEIEEFLRKKRLRYAEYIALGGPDCGILC